MPRLSLYTLSRILWALTLVCLPVTSFRYMPFLGAGTVVRPLALYPLLLLLPILLIRIWRGEILRPWPSSLTVLVLFVFSVLVSTSIGAAFAPLELRGADYADRALRALITLPIGIAFFLAAAWMNQRPEDVHFSIRWLLVGLAGHLLWGAIQFVGLNTGRRDALIEIQELFSVRGLVKNKRISGFAFEPSWLASQLTLLYLPWLMGQLVGAAGQSKKIGSALRVENWLYVGLFLASGAALLMTYSRSGLVVAALAIAVTALLAGRPLLRGLWNWLMAGFIPASEPGSFPTWLATGMRVLVILALVFGLLGVGNFLSDKGYIARLWNSDFSDLWSYLVDASLGPRAAYATASLRAFDQNPITGVGLGASGFYIYPNLPDAVLVNVPEISEALNPTSNLFPNPKNLYIRLLAEAGIVGMALFLAFWFQLWADALALTQKPGREAASLAAMSIFALSALALQAFSLDSFALPEFWLNLGILAGMAGFYLDTMPQDDLVLKEFA